MFQREVKGVITKNDSLVLSAVLKVSFINTYGWILALKL